MTPARPPVHDGADLTRFFELSPDPLIVLDRTGTIVAANAAMTKLLGKPTGSLVGTDALTWVAAEEEERYRSAYFGALEGGPPLTFIGRLRAADGGWRSLEWRIIGDPGEGLMYGAARDVTHFVTRAARLQESASTDWLTGLANRQVLMDRLGSAVAAGESVAVLYLDLDRFKQVNDAHGHPHGDEVLKVVVSRLKACIREGDLLARLGGDEFVVVSDQAAVAGELAERLVASLNDQVAVEERIHQVGLSIGIAATGDWPSADADGLLKAADEALYEAKRAGGGVRRSTMR